MNRTLSLPALTAALAIAVLLPVAAAVALSITMPAAALALDVSEARTK